MEWPSCHSANYTSTLEAERVASKLSKFQETSKRLIKIPEMEGLAIPDACRDHVRDHQTGASLVCAIHPPKLRQARRTRGGDKSVRVNAPHLREREDYGYE